jgi:hypothetical protein
VISAEAGVADRLQRQSSQAFDREPQLTTHDPLIGIERAPDARTRAQSHRAGSASIEIQLLARHWRSLRIRADFARL